MDLKKIRDLVIAKNQYNYTSDIIQKLDYNLWVDFIEKHNHYYTWVEKTRDGERTLKEIDKIPESFKNRVLKGLNKMGCVANYYPDKGFYCMKVDYNDDDKKIWISFECTPSINELSQLLMMANYLDALLLYNGKTIIDEKVIENLEQVYWEQVLSKARKLPGKLSGTRKEITGK